jgi:hypothetical protein
MDIRKADKQKTEPTETKKQTNSSNPSTSSEKLTYKAGLVTRPDAKLMLPPAVQTKLSAITQQYGLPIDLSNVSLTGDMPSQIKAMRQIVEMIEGNSKLLPELMKLMKRLFKAESKLAQFHKLTVKAAIKHQEKIDKQTADIFLQMAGYGQKASKREHRTNVRNQIIEKRTQAYSDYYQNTVYGEESKIIDVEFETLVSNKKILTDSKTQRVTFDADRKKKVNEYVNSAFTD